MSVDGGIGAVEAIGQAAKQNPAAEIQQPVQVAGDAKLAQSFELGLVKASEATAVNFQAVEEARRKTVEASAHSHVAEATQIEIRPADDQGGLGKGLSNYMEGLQGRTAAYPNELERFISSVGDIPNFGAAPFGEKLGGLSDSGTPLKAADALHIMERSFQFAVEASLVSNASQHSTKVLDDLLKGQ